MEFFFLLTVYPAFVAVLVWLLRLHRPGLAIPKAGVFFAIQVIVIITLVEHSSLREPSLGIAVVLLVPFIIFGAGMVAYVLYNVFPKSLQLNLVTFSNAIVAPCLFWIAVYYV